MREEIEKLSRQPFRILTTCVRRTYKGGRSIQQWHDGDHDCFPKLPEEWIASVTEAVNPGFPAVEHEGLSYVQTEGGTILLKELIEMAPELILGTEHAARNGSQMGILTKLIDSEERLSIQVHPDRPFAQQYFHSDYGKTECWHILSTRLINGEEPYLLIGFRPDVTREQWHDYYIRQDIPSMLASLNRVYPKAGDTFIIPGGLPHAIGPGCFLVEIQEPTDFTLRSERTMQDGTPIPEHLIHQGLGDDLLMKCFHYITMDEDEINKTYKLIPQITRFSNGSTYRLLVGKDTTDCFSMERIECCEPLHFQASGFSVLIVLSGKGILHWRNQQMEIKRSEQYFLPAGVRDFVLEDSIGSPVTCIRCHPSGSLTTVPQKMTAFLHDKHSAKPQNGDADEKI